MIASTLLAKPKLLTPCPEAIPAELQSIPRWVLWRLRWDEENKRWTKPPYAISGKLASTNDPTTWAKFDEVIAAYGDGKRYDGIGFVLDGSDHFVGVDMDKISDHLSQQEVGRIYEALIASGTYIERSPGGKGLRAFLHGNLPFDGKNNRKLGVEVYRTGRYLTVTGRRIENAGAVIVASQLTIETIIAMVSPPVITAQDWEPNIPASAPSSIVLMSDAELLNCTRNAKNGKEFSLLWDGKLDEYYLLKNKLPASRSEADMALCSMLAFWTGKDAQRIDLLFRQSGLMRPKFDEQHGEKTYGRMTIEKAITGCSRTFSPAGDSPSDLHVVRLSEVVPIPLEWLWPNFLPLGKVSLVAGNPGLGKSQITLDIAARVSTGNVWPTGESGQRGRVILICGEDDVADTIVPRLQAVGADLTQIVQIVSVIEHDEKGKIRNRALSLERDIEKLETELKRHRDTRFVVIDPISAYLGKTDSHNNAETRGLLEPLSRIAQQYRVAVLLVTHLNKGSGQAIYRTTGSIAFVAAARAAFIVAKDDNDAKKRYFIPVKMNLSEDAMGIGYEVKVATNDAPYISWDKNVVKDEDLERLLDVTPSDERPRLQEAIAWLTDKLSAGAVPSKQIQKLSKADGIAQRTLDRAKAKLGVRAMKDGAAWSWSLPIQ